MVLAVKSVTLLWCFSVACHQQIHVQTSTDMQIAQAQLIQI